MPTYDGNYDFDKKVLIVVTPLHTDLFEIDTDGEAHFYMRHIYAFGLDAEYFVASIKNTYKGCEFTILRVDRIVI